MKKILIVYHDDLIAMTLSGFVLPKDAYSVSSAVSEEQAIEQLQQNDFDLLLVGNRFDQTAGKGDEMIPRLLAVKKVPYARIAIYKHEINPEFYGLFVCDMPPEEEDSLHKLPGLLREAFS